MNKLRLISLGYSLLATMLAGTPAFAAPPGSQPAAAMPGHGVSSQAPVPKPGTGNFVERLIGELRSSGLDVSVGYPKLWTEADCAYNYTVYHNCFGNNPAAPYVLLIVKSWPEEYVDPAMANGMVRTRPGYSATYRLDPREAIIVFGRMPPEARYMGLQTYIWTTGWWNADPPSPSPWNLEAYTKYSSLAGKMTQYFFATFPPVDFATDPPVYGGRVQSFSSIDNNINNVVMENACDDPPCPPWDEIRYFVITPDRLTDEAVRTVLGSLGVDEGEIFTEGIPETFQDPDHSPPYPYGQNPDVGPLGLGKDAVDFLTGFRYSMPKDEHAANAWRKSLPLTVLRVRRPSSGAAPDPYGDLKADARPTVDEREVDDGALNSGLSSLIDAVIARAESQGLYLATPDPPKNNPEKMIDILNELGQFGPACREIGMNCLGDGQDASYFMAPPNPLDTGRIYAVVGTLATETGNGTYVGLSVNDPSLLKGVLNVDDTQLKGSAGSYESDMSTDPDKFFVHFFTRDCAAIAGLTDGACTTITKQMIPLAGDDKAPGDAHLHGKFSAGLRAYVVPNYERGPDPTMQLTPILITFTRDSP
jgi:hypothetical protein